MKLITFKYTKADGSVSDRTLLPLIEPARMVEGIDISSLSTEDQVLFSMEMQRVQTEKAEATAIIIDKYDLKHNYRRFDPAKMSEVVNDYL